MEFKRFLYLLGGLFSLGCAICLWILSNDVARTQGLRPQITNYTVIPYDCPDLNYYSCVCEECTADVSCVELGEPGPCCDYNVDCQSCWNIDNVCYTSQVEWEVHVDGVFISRTWSGTMEHDCGDCACGPDWFDYVFCPRFTKLSEYKFWDSNTSNDCNNGANIWPLFLSIVPVAFARIFLEKFKRWRSNETARPIRRLIDMEDVTIDTTDGGYSAI